LNEGLLLVGDSAYEPGIDVLRAYLQLCQRPLPPIDRNDRTAERFDKIVADADADAGHSLVGSRVTFTDAGCGHSVRIEVRFALDAPTGAAATVWCADTAAQSATAVATVADED
jgi:hypothetical protein